MKLDIPFIAYEINPAYKVDWIKRRDWILSQHDEGDFLDL
jgi:hypothetical protein